MSASAAGVDATGPGDLSILAKGGRTNFLGFLLRLAARLPFLFIAGRWYGADALGRFAYATIIVEFAAQLSTLGLKRGLAQQLAEARAALLPRKQPGELAGLLGVERRELQLRRKGGGIERERLVQVTDQALCRREEALAGGWPRVE